MDTNNLMERIQAELGYSIPIPTTPQQPTPVKSENKQNVEITYEKRENHPYVDERGKFKPGNKGGGRPKKPKDFLESLDEQLDEIRTKNADGTPGKTAAQVIAKNAIDLAVVDKDKEMIKWVVERKHGKVPNINQNTNTNIDLADILDQARGIKIVENLDEDSGEPTIVEVK